MTAAAVQVADHPAAHRFEAQVDGEIAGVLTYRTEGDDRVFLAHTEVYPQFEGKGVAKALAKAALDDIAHRQLTIVPECDFVKGYLEKHPEYAEHVAA